MKKGEHATPIRADRSGQQSGDTKNRSLRLCAERTGSQTERDLASDLLRNRSFYNATSRTHCGHATSLLSSRNG
jgi:hypothetical protein